MLLGRQLRAAVGANQDAIESQQAEDGERLISEALDLHLPPVSPRPLVEGDERADPRAVDEPEVGEIDLHLRGGPLDHLVDLRAEIVDGERVQLAVDRQQGDAVLDRNLKLHVVPSVARLLVDRSSSPFASVSRLGRPGRYVSFMNDCMMNRPRPDSGRSSSSGAGTALGSKLEPQSRISMRI